MIDKAYHRHWAEIMHQVTSCGPSCTIGGMDVYIHVTTPYSFKYTLPSNNHHTLIVAAQ